MTMFDDLGDFMQSITIITRTESTTVDEYLDMGFNESSYTVDGFFQFAFARGATQGEEFVDAGLLEHYDAKVFLKSTATVTEDAYIKFDNQRYVIVHLMPIYDATNIDHFEVLVKERVET